MASLVESVLAAMSRVGQELKFKGWDNPSLAIWDAATRLRNVKPVVVVFTGSSTTTGSSASTVEKRYVNLVNAAMQAGYPLTPSTAPLAAVRSLADAVTTPPTVNGINTINAGLSGSRSDTFLTPTTRGQIIALKPALIVHMVGSNDFGNGVTAAAFKANMITQLADIRSRAATAGVPVVQVIAHSYERYDTKATTTSVSPWSSFRQAAREIAMDNPLDVAFLDVSREFAALGMPGTDPYGYNAGDFIHTSDAGHAYLAWVTALKLKVPNTVASVETTTPPPAQTKTVLTSDTYSGADNTSTAGMTTDAISGGTSMAYTSSADAGWKRVGNRLVRGTAVTTALTLPITVANLEVSVRVPVLPSASGSIVNSIDLRRSEIASASNSYRFMIHNGQLAIIRVSAGASTVLVQSVGGVFVAGDTLTFRTVGSEISARVNGEVVLTVVDATHGAGTLVSFTASSSATSTTYDDLVISQVS